MQKTCVLGVSKVSKPLDPSAFTFKSLLGTLALRIAVLWLPDCLLPWRLNALGFGFYRA